VTLGGRFLLQTFLTLYLSSSSASWYSATEPHAMNVGKMDFTSLLKGNNTMAENMTGQSSNKMVESLLPLLQFSPVPRLLMLVYQAIGSHLGFDPTVLLTLFGSIWAINRVGRQIYHIIYAVVQENFMSSIHISNTDDIYAHMMKFLAGQPKMTNSRSLTAETVSKSAWEDEEELEAIKTTKVEDSEMAYLNFSNQEAKAVSSPRKLRRHCVGHTFRR
jgi:chaperone BCS1